MSSLVWALLLSSPKGLTGYDGHVIYPGSSMHVYETLYKDSLVLLDRTFGSYEVKIHPGIRPPSTSDTRQANNNKDITSEYQIQCHRCRHASEPPIHRALAAIQQGAQSLLGELLILLPPGSRWWFWEVMMTIAGIVERHRLSSAISSRRHKYEREHIHTPPYPRVPSKSHSDKLNRSSSDASVVIF